MELTITKAKPEDRQAVLELSQNFSEDYLEYTVDKWTRQEQGGLHLAWHNSLLVGCCSLDFPTAKEAWLQGMRVHPEYQGKGIAFQLNRYLIELAKAKRAEVARLLTAQNNLQALKVAQKLGFKTLGSNRVILFQHKLERTTPLETKHCSTLKLCESSELNLAWHNLNEGPFSKELGRFYFGPQYSYRKLSILDLKQAVAENQVYHYEESDSNRGIIITLPEPDHDHLFIGYLDLSLSLQDQYSLQNLFKKWSNDGYERFTISLIEEQHQILKPVLQKLFGDYNYEKWLLMEKSLAQGT